MKSRFSLRLALLGMIALACAFAPGDAGAQQGASPASAAGSAPATPKAVFELFTSQGCASCPPADTLLSELATDPQVIALTLAVDYWDYVGWKDTLAKHGHSVRQRAYAEQRGDRMIYTPQMVVDGFAPAKGSDKVAVEKALARAHDAGTMLVVPVSLSRSGQTLTVNVAAGPSGSGAVHIPNAAEVWLCPIVSSHTVAIGRGENQGKSVTYTNVVRAWVKLGNWTGEAARFQVPLSEVWSEGVDGAAVLVQRGSFQAPGPILGAAKIDLK
ncbi:DUF1223 domain-containing protein [Xanthobacter sp. DSM 24535]|uniref:DUF1223 domain-containing protein n=1 Tax=Roseixanthobacter psychrophilus TaxID=3119917 RepID=UPI00372B23BE